MKNEQYLFKGGVVVLKVAVEWIAPVNDKVIAQGVEYTKLESKTK